jgi:hypothetical protein
MVAGVGSGRKKKKVCRGERKEETMVILGVGGGQPVVALIRVVDLVADKLVVTSIGGWNDGERKRERR